MEENQDLHELMTRLEKQAERQTKYARRQFLVAAACGVLLVVLAFILVPRALELSARLEAVAGNLENITAELDEANLKGMVENVDALATSSQQGLQDALAKLNAIDFDTLNRAIKNLADAVEPLAKFFNLFNKN